MTDISNLPITPHLKNICDTLKNAPSRSLVLTAETGAGKSTAVPTALLKFFSGKILMLEPRRIAVLAIAQRIASLIGEQPGKTVGYRMQLDSRVSDRTQMEIITEAILTRKLLSDSLLEDVNVVIIDEFHERSIHADLALAFLKQTMQLRDDLFILVMSATINTEKIASYLGTNKNPAPIYHVEGRLFPVTTIFAGNITPAQAVLRELNSESTAYCNAQTFSPAAVLSKTGETAITPSKSGKALQPHTSDGILVFLPGIFDICRCRSELEEQHPYVDIFILHSSVNFNDQKKVLQKSLPGERRRIILSSAIAETSLTVPGVSVVIDSGQARISRYNAKTGMQRLVTETESVFSAAQRAGRAGRLGPGKCICLWNQSDPRTSCTPPEILRSDLTELVLECYEWGSPDRESYLWLDAPPEAFWNSAENFLFLTGCIADRKITGYGKAVLSLGMEPRLACTALTGLFFTHPGALSVSIQTALEYSSYKNFPPALKAQFVSNLRERIKKCGLRKKNSNNPHSINENSPTLSIETAALLAGFPDRLARHCDLNVSGLSTAQNRSSGERNESGIYQFPSGRRASLPYNVKEKHAVFPEWIIVPEVDAGESLGKIYAFKPLTASEVESWLPEHTQKSTKIEFVDKTGKKLNSVTTATICKTESVCFGKIVLSEKRLVPTPGDIKKAVVSAVQQRGLDILPLSDKTKSLLLRAQFYMQQISFQQNLNPPQKVIYSALPHSPTPEDLVLASEEWLSPFLTSSITITGKTVHDALYWYLDGNIIDKNVPEEIKLPNGRKRKITYQAYSLSDKIQEEKNGVQSNTKVRLLEDASPLSPQIEILPVLEIIIQQLFGCFETPKIMGTPVLLKLLSPARRPLQITNNLESFWQNTWPEICKEMKGRYPKHNWDYRIIEQK